MEQKNRKIISFCSFNGLRPWFREKIRKNSSWIFDKTNSIRIGFCKSVELKGSRYVKIPLPSNAILNIAKFDKNCFLWSILADSYPCENGHLSRVLLEHVVNCMTNFVKQKYKMNIFFYYCSTFTLNSPYKLQNRTQIQNSVSIKKLTVEFHGNGNKISQANTKSKSEGTGTFRFYVKLFRGDMNMDSQ